MFMPADMGQALRTVHKPLTFEQAARPTALDKHLQGL